MAPTTVERHRRRLQDLKTRRNRWDSHFGDLARFISPKRWRPNETDEMRAGDKERTKIIDSSGSFALRTLASGLHSGLTSPARPWFRLTSMDASMREVASVKAYMDESALRMRQVLATSNVYNVLHTIYGDLGLMGTGAGLAFRDPEDYIRAMSLVPGQYWIANGVNGRVDTLYRYCRMTAEQMRDRFGLNNLSNAVKNMITTGKLDERITVYHAIEPRKERDPRLPDKRNMAYLSNYWEDGSDSNTKLLEESGFRSNPILAPRWEVIGEDEYGMSPAMEVLPDIQMLQKQQAKKLAAIDKMVDPPMKGPTSMKNQPKSLLPGGITYVDDPNGQGFTPAMTVNLRISELAEDIRQTRERIERGMFADLFLMLANMEGVQPRNQLEISERKEEKLLALGPVLDRLYPELLIPVVDLTFDAMAEANILPEPPRELEGQEVKIEFVSTLAQAQKAVATGAIERVAGFIGNLAGARPDAIDKLDIDQSIDEYADMVGSPSSIIVSDERVAKIRAERLKQAQQQQAGANAIAAAPAIKQGAEAAQILSQTDAGGGGSVGELLANLGISGP